MDEELKAQADALGLSDADIKASDKMGDVNFFVVPKPEERKEGAESEKVAMYPISDKIEHVVTEFTKEGQTDPAIMVRNEDGVVCRFLMAAKSARMQYFKLRKTHGSLVNKKILVWTSFYMHETYKLQIAYRMALVEGQEWKEQAEFE